jgi:hypothetical protein
MLYNCYAIDYFYNHAGQPFGQNPDTDQGQPDDQPNNALTHLLGKVAEGRI